MREREKETSWIANHHPDFSAFLRVQKFREVGWYHLASAKNLACNIIKLCTYRYMVWMISSRSGYKWKRCNSPGFNTSILQHSATWWPADEAVLKRVWKTVPLKQKFTNALLLTSNYSRLPNEAKSQSLATFWKNRGNSVPVLIFIRSLVIIDKKKLIWCKIINWTLICISNISIVAFNKILEVYKTFRITFHTVLWIRIRSQILCSKRELSCLILDILYR